MLVIDMAKPPFPNEIFMLYGYILCVIPVDTGGLPCLITMDFGH